MTKLKASFYYPHHGKFIQGMISEEGRKAGMEDSGKGTFEIFVIGVLPV